MSKQYDEIMDRIEVTTATRRRILDHLAGCEPEQAKSSNIVKLPLLKRHLTIAACLAVLLVGGLGLPRLLQTAQPANPGVVQTANGIVKVDSAQELSAAVGFEAGTAATLPFVPEQSSYLAYWGELAETVYTGEGQTLTLRKSKGSKDNSGDYNIYNATRETTVGQVKVTMKGNDEGYSLAVWWDKDFSYSVRLSTPVTPGELQGVVEGIG